MTKFYTRAETAYHKKRLSDWERPIKFSEASGALEPLAFARAGTLALFASVQCAPLLTTMDAFSVPDFEILPDSWVWLFEGGAVAPVTNLAKLKERFSFEFKRHTRVVGPLTAALALEPLDLLATDRTGEELADRLAFTMTAINEVARMFPVTWTRVGDVKIPLAGSDTGALKKAIAVKGAFSATETLTSLLKAHWVPILRMQDAILDRGYLDADAVSRIYADFPALIDV
jgi:hypothetical protein